MNDVYFDDTGSVAYGLAWSFCKVGDAGTFTTTQYCIIYVGFRNGQNFGLYSTIGNLLLNVNRVDVFSIVPSLAYPLLTTTGRVGINTTSPLATLDIKNCVSNVNASFEYSI